MPLVMGSVTHERLGRAGFFDRLFRKERCARCGARKGEGLADHVHYYTRDPQAARMVRLSDPPVSRARDAR